MPTKKKSVEKRLASIDKRIKNIEKGERQIEREEKRVESKINDISREEKNIEKTIIRLGILNVKKRHLIELTRASAGAFLGVGIGRGLIGLDNVAKGLAWINVIGILFFILFISSLLIYKDSRENIKQRGKIVLIQRLFFIYIISVAIEFISLLLFNVQYDSTETLFKIIIVGSYTAMASAITFSLGK
jgi:hypothetical protein